MYILNKLKVLIIKRFWLDSVKKIEKLNKELKIYLKHLLYFLIYVHKFTFLNICYNFNICVY